MKIRSKERPELWYIFGEESVTMWVGKDMRSWSWSQMEPMTEGLLPRVKRELDRYIEGYQLLRKTKESERNLDWKSNMAKAMGFTYGELQVRIQRKDIVWEEGLEC